MKNEINLQRTLLWVCIILVALILNFKFKEHSNTPFVQQMAEGGGY